MLLTIGDLKKLVQIGLIWDSFGYFIFRSRSKKQGSKIENYRS